MEEHRAQNPERKRASESEFYSALIEAVEQRIDEIKRGPRMFIGILQEVDKVHREAIEVAKVGGWVGLETHLTAYQLHTFSEIAKTGGESAGDDFIRDHFSLNDHAALVAMGESWLDIPFLRDRERIVYDATAAHRFGHYTLTVPAMLPLIEGLSAEIAATAKKYKTNVAQVVAGTWKESEDEIWTTLYSDVVIDLIYKKYDFAKDSAPFLNRHGILHGRVPNYGTELNSLRVFLLVDFATELWRESRRRKTS